MANSIGFASTPLWVGFAKEGLLEELAMQSPVARELEPSITNNGSWNFGYHPFSEVDHLLALYKQYVTTVIANLEKPWTREQQRTFIDKATPCPTCGHSPGPTSDAVAPASDECCDIHEDESLLDLLTSSCDEPHNPIASLDSSQFLIQGLV